MVAAGHPASDEQLDFTILHIFQYYTARIYHKESYYDLSQFVWGPRPPNRSHTV